MNDRISFQLHPFGIVNRDPLAVGPQALAAGVGEPVEFDSSGSSDPDGDPLSVAWDFGDGESSTEALASKAFASPGVFEVRLLVMDGRGGQGEQRIPVVVAPVGEFALARTRTLNGVGHPLGGVTVEQGGDTLVSGARSGFVSLGGAPGSYAWKFSKQGHFPVWRRADLSDGAVALVPSPWLMARVASAAVRTSVLQPVVVDFGGGGMITVPADAFPQPTDLRVYQLGPQALPLPLPFGWSPVRAIAVDAASGAQPATELAFEPGAAGTMVRFDESSLDYEVLAGGSIDRAGIYVVVAGDPDVPPAVVGQALGGVGAPGELVAPSATGTLEPELSVADLNGEKVTSRATVTVTDGSASGLPSGMWFRALVADEYRLSDGGEPRLPDYDTTFFAYRQPAGSAPESLVGVFPLRPRTLFSPSELVEARVRVEVLGEAAFMGGIVTPGGGVFSGPACASPCHPVRSIG